MKNRLKIQNSGITRRQFIGGVAGLAVCLVVNPDIVLESEVERFLREAETGVVSGYTFKFDKTAVLNGFKNLTITKCTFIADHPNHIFEISNCNDLKITDCTFIKTEKFKHTGVCINFGGDTSKSGIYRG